MVEREHKKIIPQGLLLNRIVRTKDYIAQNGRPLLESRAAPEIIEQQMQAGIVFSLKKHNHTDSRSDFPDRKQNSLAYRDVINNYDTLQNDLSWVNETYFGHEIPHKITAIDAFTLTLIAKWIPPYLVLRAEKPIKHNAIPDNIANLYKTAQGLYIAAGVLVQNHGPESTVDPESIYAVANSNEAKKTESLLTETEVCPADASRIMQTTRTLFTREGGDSTKSNLGQYIDQLEFTKLKAFGVTVENFIHFNLENTSLINQVLATAKGLLAVGVKESDDKLEAKINEIQKYKDSAIKKRDMTQYDLNILLGRDPNDISSSMSL